MPETGAPRPVPSPCTNVCQLGPDDVCLGCGRDVAEIAGWTSFTDEQRAAVVERAALRMRNLPSGATPTQP